MKPAPTKDTPQWKRVKGGYERKTVKPRPGTRPLPTPEDTPTHQFCEKEDCFNRITLPDTYCKEHRSVSKQDNEQLQGEAIYHMTAEEMPAMNHASVQDDKQPNKLHEILNTLVEDIVNASKTDGWYVNHLLKAEDAIEALVNSTMPVKPVFSKADYASEQLREAIELKMLWLTHTLTDNETKSVIDCILEIRKDAQIQLVSELEGLAEYHQCRHCEGAHLLKAVSVEVLEHKKQELEGMK